MASNPENMLALPVLSVTAPEETEAVLRPVVIAIERLESVVEAETQMLLEGQHPDLVEINARKSRGLYDFTRAMNKASARAEGAALRGLQPLLDRLRQKLERNCEALQLHLHAVAELSDIIRTAIETQEADGTYTLQNARAGQVL